MRHNAALRPLLGAAVFVLLFGSAAAAQVVSGSYVGDGVLDRAITGVGFRPDVVIIKNASNHLAVIRTSTMTGDATKEFFGGALLTNRIRSLDVDGFTLGTDVEVNENGVTHHWIAFRAAAGSLSVGTYTGNGTDNRSITGIGFQPDYVITIGENTQLPYQRSSPMPAGISFDFDTGNGTDRIQALEADGFQVGTASSVNANGVVYHYAAWKAVAGTMAVGTYTGNAADDRSIPVGFRPGYVLIKGDFPNWAAHKSSSTGNTTDTTMHVGSAANEANNIQKLLVSGFEIGTHTRVNANGNQYYWMAWGGPDCSPLSVTESGGKITVTAPDSFKMVFNRAQGGALEEYYDLVEDQPAALNLAGNPSSNFYGLFHSSIVSSGTLYTTGTNTNGAELQLIEATPTRVVVRQEVFYQRVPASTTILPGLKAYGNYSIYPSGKMGLHWNRRTTASVPQSDHPLEVSARRVSLPDPRDDVTLYNQGGGLTFPRVPGTDDFVLAKRDTAGARMDLLAILHRDWPLASQLDAAPAVAFASWRDLTAKTLPAGLSESWDFLLYHKPTGFVDNTDAAVTERRDDYRNPDPIAVIGPGSGWNENPADGDFFNESDGSYTFDFDMSTGLDLEMDGLVDNRFAPFFKIRGWRSLADPTVSLAGTPLTNGADFSADVKPVSRAFFAKDLVWSSTMQNGAAVTSPEVGVSGTTNGNDFQPTPYGNGARFDLDGEFLTLPAAAHLDPTKGSIEFWYQPNYTYGAGAASDDNGFFGYWINSSNFFYGLHQPYLGGGGAGEGIYFQINSGGTVSQVVTGSGPSFPVLWRANDWVHLRFVWDLPGNRLEVWVNEKLAGSAPYAAAPPLPGDDIFYIGERNTNLVPNNNAEGIIDEFRLYSEPYLPTAVAHAGLTAHADEKLATSGANQTFDFTAVDATGRGEYAYFGADTKFHGLNVLLETLGVGTVDLQWQYWNGTSGSWVDLEQPLFGFTDETNHFTQSGTVYWTSDPTNWSRYSVSGGPDLYYVRAYLASGAYTTAPVERYIKTDILLFQYCGTIVADNQLFSFSLPVPTAVELEAFDAVGGDGVVDLSWRTASELKNLGFHLYRATSESGPYERITSRLIPGLGSSPEGADYRFSDVGLSNGVTYYYELEDVETTGRTERHGPIAATPRPAAEPVAAIGPTESGSTPRLIPYGDPASTSLRIQERGRNQIVLELVTPGFYAEPQEDGSVVLSVPGLDLLSSATADAPGLPAKRAWVEAVAGRKVRMVSVEERDVVAFSELRPATAGEPEIVATVDGTVRPARKRRSAAARSESLYPSEAARVVTVGFQGEVKKALVEMSPLRWDGSTDRLLLARRLVVRLSFAGRDPDEVATGSHGGRRRRGGPGRPSGGSQGVVARLATNEPGLYRVRFEDVMPGRPAVDVSSLRLSRQGEEVAFRVEPRPTRFDRGSWLYFVSDGAEANPYGATAVYELESGRAGAVMAEIPGAPSGTPVATYRHRQVWEENHYYQPALLSAPDRWLWDLLFAPQSREYPFEVSAVASGPEAAKLEIWLQGASDFAASPDHHVRVYVNGSFVAETRWDGKQSSSLALDLPSGLLREGSNSLELESVGDTEATYSLVMLNRFAVTYNRTANGIDGMVSGSWNVSGAAQVSGLGDGALVLETGGASPRWLTGSKVARDGVLTFRVDAGGRYLAVGPESLRAPTVTRPKADYLTEGTHQADYLVIGPRDLVEAARPLLEVRRSEGLTAMAIPVEDIFSELGHGEPTPDAIARFIAYAYHEWQRPSPRYVLLVGDATYDPKDYLGTGVTNDVPTPTIATSYLWTASDPAYAAVNGSDLLPDLAIGRLPARSVDDVRTMVEKIVAYETGGIGLGSAPVVLVADRPDGAGDFEREADALAAGVLATRSPEKLYLGRLGVASTREGILRSFDEGSALVTYLGHGGIQLWSNAGLLYSDDVLSFAPQTRQPFVITMNCLNGYFHFPYGDALAEALVKSEGRGAIAAFSPSGLSLNGPAAVYQEALLRELTEAGDGNGSGNLRLGDAVLRAQAKFLETGALPELVSIYHLFGDPALTLRW